MIDPKIDLQGIYKPPNLTCRAYPSISQPTSHPSDSVYLTSGNASHGVATVSKALAPVQEYAKKLRMKSLWSRHVKPARLSKINLSFSWAPLNKIMQAIRRLAFAKQTVFLSSLILIVSPPLSFILLSLLFCPFRRSGSKTIETEGRGYVDGENFFPYTSFLCIAYKSLVSQE